MKYVRHSLLAIVLLLSLVPATDAQAASKKIKYTNVGKRVTIYRGKTKKLKVEILKKSWRKKKIVWSVKNSKIATVTKSGKVKAKRNGKTTVRARIKGTKKRCVCMVTVKTKVKKVYVPSTKKVLVVGSKYRRAVKVSPVTASNKKLKYTSSNKKIATVSKSGFVVGKKPGTATIKVRATDGSKKKDTYKVRIIKTVSRSENQFIAHRGYSGVAPENSIPAFIRAGQAGFFGAECDVHETAAENGDDSTRRFVIMHDDTLNRMCKISGSGVDQTKLTFSQIRDKYYLKAGNGVSKYSKYERRIPTLEEYLDVCKQYHMTPVVEIKQKLGYEATKRLYKVLETKGFQDTAIVISTYRTPLNYIRENNQNIQMQYILRDVQQDDINWMKKVRADADCKYTVTSSKTIEKLHQNGIRVNVWTLNSRELAYDYNCYGVNFITTNYKVFAS